MYERRLHLQKNNCLTSLYFIKQRRGFLNASNAFSPLAVCWQFYSLLLACAQLRYRVSDYSVFLLCKQELVAIKLALNKLITATSKSLPSQKGFSRKITAHHVQHETQKELMERIDRFEDIYQNVLSVSAPDPIVFVLFIQVLKSLVDFNYDYLF